MDGILACTRARKAALSWAGEQEAGLMPRIWYGEADGDKIQSSCSSSSVILASLASISNPIESRLRFLHLGLKRLQLRLMKETELELGAGERRSMGMKPAEEGEPCWRKNGNVELPALLLISLSLSLAFSLPTLWLNSKRPTHLSK